MTTTTTAIVHLHQPNEESGCNGVWLWNCSACRARLCACELAYGHDCEDDE